MNFHTVFQTDCRPSLSIVINVTSLQPTYPQLVIRMLVVPITIKTNLWPHDIATIVKGFKCMHQSTNFINLKARGCSARAKQGHY